MAASPTVVTQYNQLTGAIAGVQFPLAEFTLAASASNVEMMLLPAATSAALFDSATNLAYDSIADNGGSVQLVCDGVGDAQLANFSATAGAHARGLYVNFGDTYSDGYYECTAVASESTHLKITLNLTFTATSSTAGVVSRMQAGALTSHQGTVSTTARTGNLMVDMINEDDYTEGFKVYLYLEGAATAENEYTLYIIAVDGTPEAAPVSVGSTFSIRDNVIMTGVKYVQSGSTGASISSGETMYVYPQQHPNFDSVNVDIAQFTVTGGTGLLHAHMIQQDSDGVNDIFAIEDFADENATTFKLQLKSTATPGTDYVRSAAGTSVTLFVTAYDAEMRPATPWSLTIILQESPVIKSGALTLNTTLNREGVDANSYPAYVWTESTYSTPTAYIELSAHAGADATMAADDETDFEMNPTYAVTYSSQSGGAVTRATFAAEAGDVHAKSIAEYMDGVVCELSGNNVTATATWGGAGTNYVDFATAYVTTSGTLTARDVDSAANRAYLALKGSKTAVAAPTYAAPAVTITENGYTFAYTPGFSVRHYKQLVAADFTAVYTVSGSSPSRRVSNGPQSRLEVPDSAAKSVAITWDGDLGIDFVYPSINGQTELTQVSSINVDAAGTETTSAFADILQAVAVTGSTNAYTTATASFTLADETASGETPADFFTADDMVTRYQEFTVAVTMLNKLDDGTTLTSESIGVTASSNDASTPNLRVYQDFAQNDAQQTRFYLDMRDDDSGGVYETGTELRNNMYLGGNKGAKTTTTIAATTAPSSFQIDDTNDAIEVADTAATAPFTSTMSGITIADQYDVNASTVALDSMDVYHFASVLHTFPTSAVNVSITLDGANVDTTVWTDFTFTHVSTTAGSVALSGGCKSQTDNAAELRTGTVTYVSDTRVSVTMVDHNAGTSTDSWMTTSSRTVKIDGTSTAYDTTSYTVHSSSTDTLLILDRVGGVVVENQGALSGRAYLVDTGLGRGVPTVVISDSAGGADNGLFDYVLQDSGSQYNPSQDNGQTSVVRARPNSATLSNYNGKLFYVRLTYPAYSASTLVTTGSVGSGISGSSEQLWAARSQDVTLSMSTLSWSLNSFSDKIYTNFAPDEDPADPTGAIYENADYQDQMRLINSAVGDGVSLTVSNIAPNDEVVICALPVAALDATTVANRIKGVTSSWAGSSTHLTYANCDTSGTAGFIAAEASGVQFAINGTTQIGWKIGTNGTEIGDANAQFANGDNINLILDPAVVVDGAKFIIIMLSKNGVTASGTTVQDAFIARCEVRYSGGIIGFTMARRTDLSFPGAVSYQIDTVEARNQSDVAIITSNALFRASTWDVSIYAQIAASNTSLGQEDSSATAADSLWQWIVLAPTVATGAVIEDTHLLNLPDGVWGAYTTVATDSGVRDSYNASGGLSYASGESLYRRIYYQVRLRLVTASTGANAANTLDDDDDEWARARIEGSLLSTDQSANVRTWGLYGREVVTEDSQYHILAGMGKLTWNNITSGTIDVYVFNNQPIVTDLVDDNDIISSSA